MAPRKSPPDRSRQSHLDCQPDGYAWRVRDMPERLRPREEMARFGAENASDEVLLAVLLRSGVRGASVVQLARTLLSKYGSFTALAQASIEELRAVKGMGKVKAQVLVAALQIATRLADERMPARCRIRSPEDIYSLMKEKIRSLDREVFWVLIVDAKSCLKLQPLPITSGLLDASLAHPREVFREAVRAAAASVLLVHNHPSGDPVPSADDIRITRQLVEAGRILGITVQDHVVIARPTEANAANWVSMRAAGLVAFA